MRALCWNGADLKLDSAYPVPQRDDRTALVKVHLAAARLLPPWMR
jgi:hypothetical protein